MFRQGCYALSRVVERRLLSSLAQGEAVQLGDTHLLRLPQRPWAASATLDCSVVQSLVGAQPESVAVLRDAFADHTQPERPLEALIARQGPTAAAVSAALARPPTRVVADHYVRAASGHYVLNTTSSSDLLRYLAVHNVRMTLVPSIRGTASGQMTSAAAAQSHSTPRQSTNEVLMVAPTAFGFNEQTAADNSFMHAAASAGDGDRATSLARTVLEEFSGLHHVLTEHHGVRVSLMQHALGHGTPDAVFPNNWISTHPVGEAAGGIAEPTLVLYPMKCPNRAAERRSEIVAAIAGRGYERILDLSPLERGAAAGNTPRDGGEGSASTTAGVHFEGTGVLVLDRVRGVAYVALSERADRALAERWVDELGYKDLVVFHSADASGHAVYHTNVMMAIGTGVAVVCGDSVRDRRERQHLLTTLGKTHEVVDISLDQMARMCGNALEVEDGRGLPVMAMSSQAYQAFTEDQRRAILRHCADIAHAPIDTLESVGGGSVRCTLAELF